MKTLYKVETANKLMTYHQAVNFLYYTQGINERNAVKYMMEMPQRIKLIGNPAMSLKVMGYKA